MIEVRSHTWWIIFIAALFQTSSPGFSQGWEISTVASGTRPSLDLDSGGNPHIAYIYEAPTGWVRYSAWNSTTSMFDTFTVSIGNFAGPPAIAVDNADAPRVNYHRHTPPPEQIYAALNGGIWTITAIASDNHDGWDNSLVFDSNNLPHTSTIDPVDIGGAASTGVEYAFFDGATWLVEAIGSAQIVWSTGTSLALDANDDPHITYYDSNTGDLMYAVKSGGTWTITSIDVGGDAGRFSSLELDGTGAPRVSYYEHLMDSTGLVKYASWNGSSWDISVVDTLHRVYLTDARTTTSLALDEQGIPHISYGDEKVLKYASSDGTSWSLETVVDVTSSATTLGQTNFIGVASSGQIHIAYYELLTPSPLTGTIKHATKVPGIPCGDLTSFLARCTLSGLVQCRLTLSMNIEHSGETVLFEIDENVYPGVIGDNGVSSRASISVAGLGAGNHTVTLIDPPGCFVSRVVTCLTAGKADAEWEADDARWAAETDRAETPAATKLLGTYPNPFNPSTTIRYSLDRDSRVTIRIYNVLGEEIAILADELQTAGQWSIVWDGKNGARFEVPSGIYFYKIIAGDNIKTDKMILTR